MAGNVIFMGSGKVDSLYGNVASPIRSIIEEKVEAAEQFMAEGKSVFYVVGLAHMIGENGIVEQLIRNGHTVERVAV